MNGIFVNRENLENIRMRIACLHSAMQILTDAMEDGPATHQNAIFCLTDCMDRIVDDCAVMLDNPYATSDPYAIKPDDSQKPYIRPVCLTCGDIPTPPTRGNKPVNAPEA